jgi:chaperonin GroES
MNIRPLHDQILVKRIEQEEVSPGGIHIPATAREKPTEAHVVAVGKGKVLDNGAVVEPSVKAGDRVLLGRYAGTEIKIDGEEHLILKEGEVLAVIGETE